MNSLDDIFNIDYNQAFNEKQCEKKMEELTKNTIDDILDSF